MASGKRSAASARAVLDTSRARLPPFDGFHQFHERINVHIKVASCSSLLLVQHAGDPAISGKLGALISGSHPSWNAPPVRDLTLALQKEQEGAISSFAVLAAFSAFDDFLIGTEAEMHRARGADLKRSTSKSKQEDDEESADRAFRTYEQFRWPTEKIAAITTVLKYFRLCRNCLAHRSGKASKLLWEVSTSSELNAELKLLQPKVRRGLPAFPPGEIIHLSSTLAIMCSHVLRLIAEDANGRLIQTLGSDGVLKLMTAYCIRRIGEGGSVRDKREEAYLGRILTKARIKFGNGQDLIRELKRIGVWNEYFDALSRAMAAHRSADSKSP
jgi:hypothetical protein